MATMRRRPHPSYDGDGRLRRDRPAPQSPRRERHPVEERRLTKLQELIQDVIVADEIEDLMLARQGLRKLVETHPWMMVPRGKKL